MVIILEKKGPSVLINFKLFLKTTKIILQTRDTWSKIPINDILLLRHDNDCGYTYKNRRYSQLIDSIEYLYNRQGVTCCTIASPFSGHIYNSYSKVYSINRIYFILNVALKLSFYSRLKKFIENVLKEFWIKILKKAKIKLIIGIQPDYYLCDAAKILNIPIYDIQHGAIESSIRLYSNRHQLRNFHPTGFLLWDSSSFDILKQSNLDVGSSLVIGNPFIYRFIRKYNDDKYVNDVEEMYNFNIKNQSKINILYSTQWGLSEYYNVDFKVIPKVIEQIINENQDKYNFFIKVHPIEGESQINILKNTLDFSKSSVFLEELKNVPLPYLLNNMDLHITYHSAVTKECVDFGINTILLNPLFFEKGEFENLFICERTNGYAKVINLDKKEILSELNKTNKKNKKNIIYDLDTESILLNIYNSTTHDNNN